MERAVPVFGLCIRARVVVSLADDITGISTEELEHLPKVDIPAKLFLRIIHVCAVHKNRYPLQCCLLHLRPPGRPARKRVDAVAKECAAASPVELEYAGAKRIG